MEGIGQCKFGCDVLELTIFILYLLLKLNKNYEPAQLDPQGKICKPHHQNPGQFLLYFKKLRVLSSFHFRPVPPENTPLVGSRIPAPWALCHRVPRPGLEIWRWQPSPSPGFAGIPEHSNAPIITQKVNFGAGAENTDWVRFLLAQLHGLLELRSGGRCWRIGQLTKKTRCCKIH